MLNATPVDSVSATNTADHLAVEKAIETGSMNTASIKTAFAANDNPFNKNSSKSDIDTTTEQMNTQNKFKINEATESTTIIHKEKQQVVLTGILSELIGLSTIEKYEALILFLTQCVIKTLDLPNTKIDLNQSLFAGDIKSPQVVKLLTLLSKSFNLDLLPTLLVDNPTLNKLAVHILNCLSSTPSEPFNKYEEHIVKEESGKGIDEIMQMSDDEASILLAEMLKEI